MSSPATVEVQVRVMDTDTMREVVATLGDAREAICAAMSDGWEVFSDETQNELGGILDRIDRIGATP